MGGKILYVEDDEINAFLMRRYLNKWDVDLASDIVGSSRVLPGCIIGYQPWRKQSDRS